MEFSSLLLIWGFNSRDKKSVKYIPRRSAVVEKVTFVGNSKKEESQRIDPKFNVSFAPALVHWQEVGCEGRGN